MIYECVKAFSVTMHDGELLLEEEYEVELGSKWEIDEYDDEYVCLKKVKNVTPKLFIPDSNFAEYFKKCETTSDDFLLFEKY